MGKGDQKTRRGKLFSKTYGVRRPRKKNKSTYKPVGISKAVAEEKKVKPVNEVKVEEVVEKEVVDQISEPAEVIPEGKKEEKKEAPKEKSATETPKKTAEKKPEGTSAAKK